MLEGLAAGVWSRALTRAGAPFIYWLALHHVAAAVLAGGGGQAAAGDTDGVVWALRPLAEGFGEWADAAAVGDLLWVPDAPDALAQLMRGAAPAAGRAAPPEVAAGRARRLLSVFPAQGQAAAADPVARARDKIAAALRGP